MLPDLVMVAYDVPDDLAIDERPLADMPQDWRQHETMTQSLGRARLAGLAAPLLRVPSAVVALAGSPDLDLLINHRHPQAQRITIAAAEAFALDLRLLTF